MKDLSSNISEIDLFISTKHIKSISLDIDGTLYPLRFVEWRWWKKFFVSPVEAIDFILIRKRWEKKRKGQNIIVTPEDVFRFEKFLLKLLTPDLIKASTLDWLTSLKSREIKAFYLTDHSVSLKLKALALPSLDGSYDGLALSGELKPHKHLAEKLITATGIEPQTHLHIGDRWSDEEQARLMGCWFLKI